MAPFPSHPFHSPIPHAFPCAPAFALQFPLPLVLYHCHAVCDLRMSVCVCVCLVLCLVCLFVCIGPVQCVLVAKLYCKTARQEQDKRSNETGCVATQRDTQPKKHGQGRHAQQDTTATALSLGKTEEQSIACGEQGAGRFRKTFSACPLAALPATAQAPAQRPASPSQTLGGQHQAHCNADTTTRKRGCEHDK